MRRTLACIALAGLATSAAAQKAAMPKPMKALVFRDANFTGPSQYRDATDPFFETPWPVRSLKMSGDGQWQLCSDTVFDGQCILIERNTADLLTERAWRWPVGSIRAICASDDGKGAPKSGSRTPVRAGR